MIESKDEFNDLLNRLKAKDKENKLGKSLQTKLQAFLEVEKLINLPICGVVKSLRDEMAIGFAQTKMQVWDGELTNKHREKVLEDWIRRNGDDLTIAEHIVKDAYFLADEMLRLR